MRSVSDMVADDICCVPDSHLSRDMINQRVEIEVTAMFSH